MVYFCFWYQDVWSNYKHSKHYHLHDWILQLSDVMLNALNSSAGTLEESWGAIWDYSYITKHSVKGRLFFFHQLVSCIQCNRISVLHILLLDLMATEKTVDDENQKVQVTQLLQRSSKYCILSIQSDVAMQWQRFIIPLWTHMDSFLILIKTVIRSLICKIKATGLN